MSLFGGFLRIAANEKSIAVSGGLKRTKMSDALQPPLQQCGVSRSTLLFGDCLIESDKIESGSVDLILTDLPYGIMQPNHNGIAYKKMYGNIS